MRNGFSNDRTVDFLLSLTPVAIPTPAKGGRLYFTADTHFRHENLVARKYCPARPCETVSEMHALFEKRWNETVKSDRDVVVVVGDFFWKGRGGAASNPLPDERFDEMRRILKRLRGKKILVRGNHDKFKDDEYLKAGFSGVGMRAEVEIDGETYSVFHEPSRVLVPWFSGVGKRAPEDVPFGYREKWDEIQEIPGRFLCGHVHQMWRRCGPFLNVGVDVHDFAPLAAERVPGMFLEEAKFLASDAEANGFEERDTTDSGRGRGR